MITAHIYKFRLEHITTKVSGGFANFAIVDSGDNGKKIANGLLLSTMDQSSMAKTYHYSLIEQGRQ